MLQLPLSFLCTLCHACLWCSQVLLQTSRLLEHFPVWVSSLGNIGVCLRASLMAAEATKQMGVGIQYNMQLQSFSSSAGKAQGIQPTKVFPGSALILGSSFHEEELHPAALFFSKICQSWHRSHSVNTTHCAEYLHPNTSVALLSCGCLTSSCRSFCSDLRVAADGSSCMLQGLSRGDEWSRFAMMVHTGCLWAPSAGAAAAGFSKDSPKKLLQSTWIASWLPSGLNPGGEKWFLWLVSLPDSFSGCLHCAADHCLHIPLLEGHLVLPKNHNTALLAVAQTGTSGRKKGLVLARLGDEALNVVRSMAASPLGTFSLGKAELLQKGSHVSVSCFHADSASSPGASRKPPARCCVLVFHKCAEGLTDTWAARRLHGSSCPPGFPDLRGLGEKFCSLSSEVGWGVVEN